MPHDLFIVGCGRSGTSLVAGLFSSAGYFQGGDLHPPRPSNPRGFFEDVEINDINETLLRPCLPERRSEAGIEYLADSPVRGQRWLARLPLDLDISCAPSEQGRIDRVVRRRPFCLKDPRFCYTLHLWRERAPSARMVCVFRHPQVVVASILREMSVMPYLENLALSIRQVFEVWRLMYSHVLERHCRTGDWLFVEYEDLFRPETLDLLADFSQAPVDRAFPDRGLNRSHSISTVDAEASRLYDKLIRSKVAL
ncbi:MAG TPA: sulfotransferase [Xanthobacteraceae bacterium]|nr:sulfotransferase [Xanthobacteraceae bacterium]